MEKISLYLLNLELMVKIHLTNFQKIDYVLFRNIQIHIFSNGYYINYPTHFIHKKDGLASGYEEQ